MSGSADALLESISELSLWLETPDDLPSGGGLMGPLLVLERPVALLLPKASRREARLPGSSTEGALSDTWSSLTSRLVLALALALDWRAVVAMTAQRITKTMRWQQTVVCSCRADHAPPDALS